MRALTRYHCPDRCCGVTDQSEDSFYSPAAHKCLSSQPCNHMPSWQVAQGIRRDSFLKNSKDPNPKRSWLSFSANFFSLWGALLQQLSALQAHPQGKRWVPALLSFLGVKAPSAAFALPQERGRHKTQGGRGWGANGNTTAGMSSFPCRGARCNFSFKT